jgi:hypothetical protein
MENVKLKFAVENVKMEFAGENVKFWRSKNYCKKFYLGLLEKHSALQVRAITSKKLFVSFYDAISAAPDPAAKLNSPEKMKPDPKHCLCVQLDPLPVSRGEENGRGPTRPSSDLRLQVGGELQRLLHPGVASFAKISAA